MVLFRRGTSLMEGRGVVSGEVNVASVSWDFLSYRRDTLPVKQHQAKLS